MAYAEVSDVQARMSRDLTAEEQTLAATLLDDAAVLIDSYNSSAGDDAKKIVSCRMVIRTLGDGEADIPIGATQGSMSGLGYSQSWTIGNGSAGELWLSKLERQMLGLGNKIGAYSPVEDMTRSALCGE